jgi:hypothetical protein
MAEVTAVLSITSIKSANQRQSRLPQLA